MCELLFPINSQQQRMWTEHSQQPNPTGECERVREKSFEDRNM